MLAYVFWHWRRTEIERDTYEQHLLRFHQALNEHKPQGFVLSSSFRIELAPWLPAKSEAYEDWYLIDGSAVLDRLEQAAISGARQAAHDQAASGALGGTAGLYRLRAGTESLSAARVAYWLAKPPGINYTDFYRLLAPWTSHCDLWGRQMTLGPTSEFCLHAETNLALPSNLNAVVMPLEKIW
ncbi:hypothetical protein HUU05_03955 [candidate division KSB1 bacterium]|nr:hypothetical protein [candidate division KSB1 bacterium]